MEESALRRKAPHNRKGEPVLLGVQGAELLGQRVRQHGQAVLCQVCRCAPLGCVGVDVGGGAHEEGDICYVHPHLIGAVRTRLDVDGVVQVLGRGRVDGVDAMGAEVAAKGQLLRDNVLKLGRRQIRQHLLREA